MQDQLGVAERLERQDVAEQVASHRDPHAPATGFEFQRVELDLDDLAAGARNAPGAAAINDLIDTIGFYAIIACLVGLLLSGLILVIGPRIGFDRASTVGKVGIFASLGGAFLIGISATLVNFFYNAGA